MMAIGARLSFIGLLAVLLLSGCGFHLRGEANLPTAMARTQVVIDDEYSALGRNVRILLEQGGVRLVAAQDATAVLEIPVNRLVTEVLTIADNARVREYRMTHTVRFRLTDRSGRELVGWQTLQQSREISFDEQRILATSREQEYLKEDLAETLAQMLVARLESASAARG
ncbi:MAG: LPS assembly lipoprotein LptE [Lysobacterales bacterium]|jgi:LPS-assembly lipoprotein